MFTGIIETIGEIISIEQNGTNLTFDITSTLGNDLKVDQSVSHNGICLTVEKVYGLTHQVTAIEETIKKTNAANWTIGKELNLERCLKIGDRLDGHWVQGHVDTTALCLEKRTLEGSWEFTFELNGDQRTGLMIEKGSISLNGISLTCFNVGDNRFSVAIIPYTFHHTNMKSLEPGHFVNIEFDMIGKYFARHLAKYKSM